MKTKNIFKALAFALLITTACNRIEVSVKKGYELPVIINATRQGDNPATRATYNGSTRKLEFSTGDKLFATGAHATAGQFAGTLTWVSEGAFSGTIIPQYEYSGTALELLETSLFSLAFLLPADYEDYGYLSIDHIDGFNDLFTNDFSNSFALTKATAIEQFSRERGNYVPSIGYVLSPLNAILNFTINGLTASTEYAVVVSDGSADRGGNVTTNGSGTATFAVGVSGGTESDNITLTVGGTPITLNLFGGTNTEFVAGHVYNVNRSAAPAAATGHALSASVVGDVVGTDGLAYDVADKDNLPTGVTAAGMVAYKSGSNGLVIALADEASTMDWSTANGASGAAAHTPTVTGQTWKLPSQAEWNQIFSANGGSETSYTGLNTAITSAGGTALTNCGWYWSSTEYDPDSEAYYVVLDGDASWNYDGESSLEALVRACIAFSSAPAAKAAAEATAEDKGKLIGADGNIYDNADAATAASTTAVALIAYVGNDAETSTTYNHGLALALSDVSGTPKWCTQTSNTCLTTQYESADTDMAGIANTDALVGHGSHTHAAASAARNYSVTRPIGTSDWFLPSAGQWKKMAGASGYGLANLTATAGGYTGLTTNTYWSSSERSSAKAWGFRLSDGWIISADKNYTTRYVRACLAF